MAIHITYVTVLGLLVLSAYMPQLVATRAATLKNPNPHLQVEADKDQVTMLQQTSRSQFDMISILAQIVSTQNQLSSTQNQMSDTLTEIARTQNQMVSLLRYVNTVVQNQTKNLQDNSLDARLSPLIAHDCTDILNQDFDENYGIYTIKPTGNNLFVDVSCDLQTDGGGWIVFQRRLDGAVDFYRGWEDYKNGFGDLRGEHWLGLEKIHWLTSVGVWQLRIVLEDFEGNTSYAQYDNFAIDDESTYYRLTIGAYSGTAGDELSYHANQGFSTHDQDHDTYIDNCAELRHGAWWYVACSSSNLNGNYVGSGQMTFAEKVLNARENTDEVLNKAQMMIRRI